MLNDKMIIIKIGLNSAAVLLKENGVSDQSAHLSKSARSIWDREEAGGEGVK